MCPEIEIDAEVLNALKERAEPFVDTPNSVLRHLLELDPSGTPKAEAQPGSPSQAKRRRAVEGKKRRRAPAGTLLPEQEYELPILRALQREGGRAPAREVIAAAGEELGAKLTERDRETLATGAFRWENRAQFTRLRLKERGLIETGSPRGIWEISEQGKAFLARAREEDDGRKA
jgi:Mrr N-terminal domain